jgi:hypothetical protein
VLVCVGLGMVVGVGGGGGMWAVWVEWFCGWVLVGAGVGFGDVCVCVCCVCVGGVGSVGG